MKRIGVSGGSFDPIHNGHLHVAREALESFNLDEVLFVPANRSPYKLKGYKATNEQRLEMVRRAIAPFPKFKLSTVDLDRPSPSWTKDTLLLLQEQFKNDRLVLLMGSDVFSTLHEWEGLSSIVEIADIGVVERAHIIATVNGIVPKEYAVWLHSRTWEFVRTGRRMFFSRSTEALDVSSTAIRRARAAKRPINSMVPEAVNAYIEEQGLYL